MKSNVDSCLRIIKLLYETYNQRDVKNVCDFELEYGLLSGRLNILHLAFYVCRELTMLSGAEIPEHDRKDLPNLVEEQLKTLVEHLGFGDLWLHDDDLIESLLTELLCLRFEKKQCYQSAVFSREFLSHDIVSDEILTLMRNTHVGDEDVNVDTLLTLFGSRDEKLSLSDDRLFEETNLDEETVAAIRVLSESLCDEYNERWNLYLVRFDSLLKVFLQSSSLAETPALKALLNVIHVWRNRDNSRFKRFNIYDVYMAFGNILEIRKASASEMSSDLVQLYLKISNHDSGESLQSFIKKIKISEPPHRGGLPKGFSTKKFYKKFSKH
ncbi:bacteriolytic enzyme, putative [Babesia caballi]|uniref:Bacteriolytic enzyme, putative n=1 Tax=Babesia caballi TaxID=5871 RepID=A0AAV4LRK1_BABCB|nr:bacteriolytic enzyme, putative [Babesia caballi]